MRHDFISLSKMHAISHCFIGNTQVHIHIGDVYFYADDTTLSFFGESVDAFFLPHLTLWLTITKLEQKY